MLCPHYMAKYNLVYRNNDCQVNNITRRSDVNYMHFIILYHFIHNSHSLLAGIVTKATN